MGPLAVAGGVPGTAPGVTLYLMETLGEQGLLWEVIGGADRGGIIVREGLDLNSEKCPERLAYGALIQEEELVDERLRYKRLTGSGPATGWVSIRLPDKE